MTSKLPRQLSGRELIKILGKFGFKVKRVGRGSHVFLFKAEKGKKLITSVPVRDKHIGAGLLRKILRQTNISREEFLKYV